ncbi:receptor-type tyrosine-protein phosphatase S-like isoform X2 [Rhopilema esculentum]|uniref:receptor-type tyrosine-protein phosphatase S-like isoform X2 n=1 Tax=Rhopilema esculentum TaxID=499914 RepID=UPI0031DFAB9E
MLLTILIATALQFSGIYSLEPAAISKAPENVTIAYNSSQSTLQNAVFNCTFLGDPLPEVQWYNLSANLANNSKYVISGSKSSSILTVVGADVNDVGSYSCNVTNNQSSVAQTAYLNVQVFTRILTHPQSTVLNESTSSLKLSCDADGVPAPTFQWKKDGSVLHDSSKTKYTESGKSLTISNLTRNDTGSYVCMASNGWIAVSNAATVTVNYIDPIALNTSSTSIVLNETSSFFVECTANSNPTAAYSWTNKAGTVVSSTSVLSISSVNRNHNGSYTCTATNNAGLTVSKSLTLDVRYIDAIAFNTSSTSIVLNETSSFFVECTANSNPTAAYSWTNKAGTVVSSTSVLSISSVNRSQNGSYTCTATNSAGLIVSKSLTLDVHYIDAIAFNTSSTSIVLNETSSFFVECTAKSNPTAAYSWTNKAGTVVSSSSVLSISSVNRNQNGSYTCTATNNAGLTVSKTLTLDVRYIDAIAFNTSSTSIVLNETSSFFVECTAKSNPTAAYSWTNKAGTVVSSSSVLSISSVNRNQNGSYTCTATNNAGLTVSKTLTLDVYFLDAPTFNTSSNSIVLTETTPLGVQCATSSNPSSTYKWYAPTGNVISSSSILYFQAVQRNDSGAYTCSVTNGAGKAASKVLNLNVEYIDRPALNVSVSKIILNETDQLYVLCTSTSNPNAEYHWVDSSGASVVNAPLLSFPALKRSDAKTYSCIANNKVGKKTSANLTIEVNYLDKPSLNATASVNVTDSSRLLVRCSAVSHPPAQFYWQSSAGIVLSSSADLRFETINRNNSGGYFCVAKNSFGTSFSNTVTVNVQYVDTPIFNTSSAVVITESQMLHVQCTVTSNPAASLEWKTLSGTTISKTSLLSFDSIHRNNSGNYVCTATNSVASKSSSTLEIVVQSIDSPRFNTSNHNSLKEGDPFYAVCSTTAYPITDFRWETYSGTVVSNTPYLQFTSLKRNDSNTYVCIGSNAAGTKRSINLTIDVRYIDMPTFTGVKNVIINESSPLQVHCTTKGNPAPDYEWVTASGTPVSSSAILNFASINRANASVYMCKVSNNVGNRLSGNLTVIVHYLDAPIVKARVTFRNGSASTIECSVEGLPKPAISWNKGDALVSSQSTLTWNPILKNNAGTYFCLGANKLGTKQSQTAVTVEYPPVVTVTSSHILPFVRIGTSLELVCVSDSVPPSNVTWKHKNNLIVKGTNSARLNLSLQRDSTSNYTCLCENDLGTAHVVKEVIVQERPDPPSAFQVTKKESRWITLSWQAPFNGNSRISQYVLKYGTDAANLDKENRTQSLQYNVSGLLPFTVYHFNIAATNSLGSSHTSNLSEKTSTEAPPLKKDAISSPAPSKSTVTMLLKKFDDTNGKISFYQIIVVKSSSSSSSSRPDDLTGLQGYSAATSNTPYITAEFSSSVFEVFTEWHFTVGDEKRTSRNKTTTRARRSANQEYYNAPLEAGTEYKAFFRAYINDLEFRSTNWLEFKTTAKDEGLSAGAIAGIVIGCLLALFLVAVFVFRYMRNREDEKDNVEEEEKKPHRPSFLKRSFMKPRLADPTQPVSRDSFEIHVNNMRANSGYGFSQEYQMIDKRYRHSYNHSTASYNTLKNRYANIHAYDHSRVVLQSDNTPGSDYINANYIGGFNGDREYVAAQGPLPETISDFWRMVWEKDCSTIVMLTNVQEKGRQKCAQYWPTCGSATFKALVVNVLEVLEYPDLVITTFHITKVGQAVERTLKHFHFISWPDFGVPSEPSILFSLIKKVNRWRKMAPQNGPLIVHCSAGVGRTGTYIVIDTQLNRLANERDVAIYSNVSELREQRYLMVQTEDQYAYIHFAVLEYIKSGDTEIEAHDLRDYIKRKSDVDATTGSTGLMDEFVSLARDETHHTFHEASKVHNQSKNRYKNVYPYDSTRIRLSQINNLSGSDYINASHIDGYVQEGAFIASQAPLERTFEDFWRMIWEKDSRTIVMLSKEEEGGKVKVNAYWPNGGSIKIGILIIELVSEEKFSDYILRVFKLTNSEGQSRCVRHYQYTSWPENAPPESAFGVIDLIGQVSKWNTTVGNRPVTVHCSAGVGRTGVFIALTNLIERLKTEAMVDVYQAVRKLRLQRTAMVQTRDQYEFCYRALQEYLDSFDHYANFE